MQDDLTILTVTHFQENPDQYGELGPPSAEFLERSVDSLRNSVTGAESCNHILYYNEPTGDIGPEQRLYRENLETFCSDYGLEFISGPNRGLQRAMERALDRIQTPFVMFVEHDWLFRQMIDLESIVEAFRKHPELNYVRFNKLRNERADEQMVEETRKFDVPLIKTNTFSNNPFVARRNELETWVDIGYPAGVRSLRCLGLVNFCKELVRIRLLQNPRNNGLERLVQEYFDRKIEAKGFDDAHDDLGIFIFGGMTDEPYVEHLTDTTRKSHPDSLSPLDLLQSTK